MFIFLPKLYLNVSKTCGNFLNSNLVFSLPLVEENIFQPIIEDGGEFSAFYGREASPSSRLLFC